MRDPKSPLLPPGAKADPRSAATRWYERLRDIVLRSPEPASRSFRYLARLIEREFGGRTTGLCIGISAIEADQSPTDALLMLAYCLRSELEGSVLLIDARLRDLPGGISSRLGFDSAQGYADLMRSGPGAQQALVQPTRVAGVDVIPAGRPEAGINVNLDPATLRCLLDWAKGEYDYVLVQVGSVLRDTRNVVTAAQVDVVFLVADEHKTFMKSLDDCRQLLASNGVSEVRVIVSGATL